MLRTLAHHPHPALSLKWRGESYQHVSWFRSFAFFLLPCLVEVILGEQMGAHENVNRQSNDDAVRASRARRSQHIFQTLRLGNAAVL